MLHFPISLSYRKLILAISILTALVLSPEASALKRSQWNKAQYQAYLHLPSEKLIKMGDKFLDRGDQPDSAVMCFTVVAERYTPNMSRREMALCLEGFYGRWATYFFGLGNFPSAFEDLRTTEEIVDKTGLPAAKLHYYYGICFMNLGTGSREPTLYSQAEQRFLKSFNEAIKLRDARTLHRAFDNLITAAFMLDSVFAIAPQAEKIAKVTFSDPWRIRQSLAIYHGMLAQEKKDYPTALKEFNSLIYSAKRTPENMRYIASFYLKRIRVLESLDRYDLLPAQLDTLFQITYKYRQPDVRIAALSSRIYYYETIGDSLRARQDKFHYLELRDSLRSDQFLANFQEVKHMSERRRLQRNIDAMTFSTRLRGWIIVTISLLLTITAIFTFFLNRSYRKLRQRSEMLYRQLQSEVAFTDDETWISRPATIIDDKEETHDEAETETEKYAGSTLTSGTQNDIANKIRDIILRSDKIYDPDFSLSTLADLVGSNRKYVSQCINDTFDCNFWTLVNRARIREAMRRFDNKAKYGNYSIEGIAESVGFRSRSSFSAWFKKFTGLGAAEYRRLGLPKS